MRKWAVALAITALIVMVGSLPASAQSWFTLRINPSKWNWTTAPGGFGDLPYNGTINVFGATGFWQFPGQKFGLRGNWDSGSLSSWGCAGGPPCSYDGGNWRWYDIGLGVPYNFAALRTLWFIGYGNTDWRASSSGTVVSQQTTSGLALGVDFWFPLGPSALWYATGNVTYGPSQHWRYCNPPGTTCGSDSSARYAGSATVSNYSIGLGRNLSQMTSVELGWRTGGFGGTKVTVGGDQFGAGQTVRWSGYYLAVAFRW